jgi:hypothetical protein
MLPQPTLRVVKKERDVYEVEVAAARPTRHSVTAGAGDVERLTGGKANAERLIQEGFRFLLERKSNTSILRSFRITDISHYFPEYEREIRRRLGTPARGGAQVAPAGNLDALLNKYLAGFRNADQLLAQAQALVQTYRERYPELAASHAEGESSQNARAFFA